MLIRMHGNCAGRCIDGQCIRLTDVKLTRASHTAVIKSVKRLNTHIIFKIICIY